MNCDKLRCIANLNGECVAEKCRGEIRRLYKSKCMDKKELNKIYNLSKDSFESEFDSEDLKNDNKTSL